MARDSNGLTPEDSLRAQDLAEQCLRAYPQGYFPMAKPDPPHEIEWVYPYSRGILPITAFPVSRSLRRQYRQNQAQYRFSYENFSQVLTHCAQREETWISPVIKAAFEILHEQGYAHALAVWENNELIGGVYGLALGGAFFGESMFSRSTGGSKLALWALRAHLAECGYAIFDTQFLTEHLQTLGGYEMDHKVYLNILDRALSLNPEKLNRAEKSMDWPSLLSRALAERAN